MNEQDKTKAMRTIGWLKWFGDRRDGFLVAGAVLYGLGYAVWSYNAWMEGLGVLPAIDSQYFLAGVIPASVIYVSWKAIVFADRYREQNREWFKNHPVYHRIALRTSVILAVTPGRLAR